jgi:hypothetical protein
MNTRKPTKHVETQREPSYRRDELIARGASSNASHTTKHYSQQDHLADNRFRHLNRQHGERESDGHRTRG